MLDGELGRFFRESSKILLKALQYHPEKHFNMVSAPRPITLGLLIAFVIAGGTACSTPQILEEPTFESAPVADLLPVPVDMDVGLSRAVRGTVPPSAPVRTQNTPVALAEENDSPAEVHAPAAQKLAPSPRGTNRKPASFRRKQIDGTIRYVVKPNDTLMKIAFEVFGNVYRWKEIYEQNRSKIGKFNSLSQGTVLQIAVSNAVQVKRNGNPYLIRKRDTLYKISGNVYGTPRRWWSLWDNNRELIHDPNRIYAGFTLYYIPDSKLTRSLPAEGSSSTGSPRFQAVTLETRSPASDEAGAETQIPSSTGSPTEEAENSGGAGASTSDPETPPAN